MGSLSSGVSPGAVVPGEMRMPTRLPPPHTSVTAAITDSGKRSRFSKLPP